MHGYWVHTHPPILETTEFKMSIWDAKGSPIPADVLYQTLSPHFIAPKLKISGKTERLFITRFNEVDSKFAKEYGSHTLHIIIEKDNFNFGSILKFLFTIIPDNFVGTATFC